MLLLSLLINLINRCWIKNYFQKKKKKDSKLLNGSVNLICFSNMNFRTDGLFCNYIKSDFDSVVNISHLVYIACHKKRLKVIVHPNMKTLFICSPLCLAKLVFYFFCITQKKISRRIFWRCFCQSMGFSVVLDPTDLHWMEKTVKTSFKISSFVFWRRK